MLYNVITQMVCWHCLDCVTHSKVHNAVGAWTIVAEELSSSTGQVMMVTDRSSGLSMLKLAKRLESKVVDEQDCFSSRETIGEVRRRNEMLLICLDLSKKKKSGL